MFMDLMDADSQMFSYDEGEISIGPYENFELSFTTNQSDLSSSSVGLSIWPSHHEYALKELIYDVTLGSGQNNGDINQDGSINVLDIVVLVNIILDTSLNPEYADLNNDGEINVIDVVILVNQILGS
jgi:hypothetical protein